MKVNYNIVDTFTKEIIGSISFDEVSAKGLTTVENIIKQFKEDDTYIFDDNEIVGEIPSNKESLEYLKEYLNTFERNDNEIIEDVLFKDLDNIKLEKYENLEDIKDEVKREFFTKINSFNTEICFKILIGLLTAFTFLETKSGITDLNVAFIPLLSNKSFSEIRKMFGIEENQYVRLLKEEYKDDLDNEEYKTKLEKHLEEEKDTELERCIPFHRYRTVEYNTPEDRHFYYAKSCNN